MDKTILEKEEKYHKINAELDKKTKALWKEVEEVMKIQDGSHTKDKCRLWQPASLQNLHGIGSGSSGSLTVEAPDSVVQPPRQPSHGPVLSHPFCPVAAGSSHGGKASASGSKVGGGRSVRQRSLLSNLDLARKYSNRAAGGEEISLEDVMPPEAKDFGADATIRFLKAKTKVLHEEYASLQGEYHRQSRELQRALEQLQQKEQSEAQWRAQAERTKEQLVKQEQWAVSADKKLTEKDMEITSLKKDLEKLKREVKALQQQQSSSDVRLNRALEEATKLKNSLKTAKQEEKERAVEHKKKYEEMVVTVRKLEKQKLDLITAFKKELQLIDNLKKQKAYLEANRVTQFTEDEFLQLLEWNPNTVSASGDHVAGKGERTNTPVSLKEFALTGVSTVSAAAVAVAAIASAPTTVNEERD